MARLTSTRYQISYVNPATRDEPADVPADMKRLVDAIEVSTMFSEGNFSARPAAGIPGRFYFAEDQLILYYDNGSTWTAIGPISPTQLVPTGTILEYGGTSAPGGFLMADGTSYLVANYTALHGVIGYTYGGSGANFNVPNKKGRVGVGRDVAFPEFDTLGESGGERYHTITDAEMPIHDHVIVSDGTHQHNSAAGVTQNFLHTSSGGNLCFLIPSDFGVNPNGIYGWPVTENAGAHNHTGGTGNAGGDSQHNNLQPYLTLNYIIKT